MASLETTDLDERVTAKATLDLAENSLQSLCASHAPTFVAVERRGALLANALNSLLEKLTLADPKVKLAQSSLEAEEEVDDNVIVDGNSTQLSLAVLTEKHRLRRRTLLQHSALLELLELPSLMDASVRSNLYDEALSISSFANTLERRHLQDPKSASRNKVVGNVVSEVRIREMDLRKHLIHRLRGEMSMPQCLEVVTALRRLNSVELERRNKGGILSSSEAGEDVERIHGAMELRLQVDFFESRDAWLDSTSSSFSPSVKHIVMGSVAQSEQLLDSIERYRTRCFEIATQFMAIFRASSAVPNSFNPSSSVDHSLSLLSLWTTRRIQIFLTSLTHELKRIEDTAGLRDALDATVFFSTSMARIGADFQSLLSPIFEPRLVNIVSLHWMDGIVFLNKTLQICREAGIASPLFKSTQSNPVSEEIEEDSAGRADRLGASGNKTPSSPRQLLSYPPLARLLNSYLTGLNELRRCLLIGTFYALKRKLENTVEEVQTILKTNLRAVLTPGMKGESTKLREVAAEMKDLFDQILVPYMNLCLDVAFGMDFEQMEREEAKEADVHAGDSGESSAHDNSKKDVDGNDSITSANDNTASVKNNEATQHDNEASENENEALQNDEVIATEEIDSIKIVNDDVIESSPKQDEVKEDVYSENVILDKND